ncbi:tetratricopeptide repeat protein [Hugenholtzia roseola]|uniref:tetratricopeptide repeat protein n=1 Tax=Hugenholtzia roseola TaxID=1002 RepID=UPI000423465F|nr:tetratricopeptide repeat protein [Hugenholtzia roseola]
MRRPQYLLSGVALLAILLLAFLPKGVLKKEGTEVAAKQTQTATETPQNQAHNKELAPAEQAKLEQWKTDFAQSQSLETAQVWADSVAQLYTLAQQLDSAAAIYDRLATRFPSDSTHLRAARAYYEGVRFMLQQQTVAQMSEKAQSYYQVFLEKQDPKSPIALEAQAELAMTYMRTSTPMKGVALLRQNLEINPKHLTTLENLGLLSMESGQYQKAVDYFQQVCELKPNDLYADFSLASAYAQAGKKELARPLLEGIVAKSTDPALINAAKSYLEQF